MNYLEKARRVIDLEIEELNRLGERIGESFSRAVDTLKERLEARSKIVVCGVGKS
ncbi:MAG: Arabinose 5-phosphate isomerase KdsD, partial [Verrucomicrobiota bacterium]